MPASDSNNVPLVIYEAVHTNVQIATTMRCNAVFSNFTLHHATHPTTVAATHRALLATHIKRPIQWLTQVHGTQLLVIKNARKEVVADASYTNQRNCALAVLTADCLPIVLYSQEECALVHAGWRSLSDDLILITLAAFDTPLADICAWLGPAIRQSSYQVGEDMRNRVLMRHADWDQYFIALGNGKWLYDLAGCAIYQLRQAGLRQIDDCALNTAHDTRYYSYRTSGQQAGRFATLVWLA